MTTSVDERAVSFLTFRVGPETFIFDIMRVSQIVPHRGTISVPGAPDFIEGVIVLRGEVIPVIDLHDRFFPESDPPEAPLVLITRTSVGTLGFKVDEVRRILTVELGEIMPSPGLIHGLRGKMFVGVVERDDTVYLLLDLDNLLSPAQQRAHEEADYELPEGSES